MTFNIRINRPIYNTKQVYEKILMHEHHRGYPHKHEEIAKRTNYSKNLYKEHNITSLKGLSSGGVEDVYLRKVVPTKTPPLRNTRVISAIWHIYHLTKQIISKRTD